VREYQKDAFVRTMKQSIFIVSLKVNSKSMLRLLEHILRTAPQVVLRKEFMIWFNRARNYLFVLIPLNSLLNPLKVFWIQQIFRTTNYLLHPVTLVGLYF
jgi:hypothetical protein